MKDNIPENFWRDFLDWHLPDFKPIKYAFLLADDFPSYRERLENGDCDE